MEDYGIKMSVPGKPLEKKDEKELGASSRFNTLKTHASGVTSKQVNSFSFATHQIPHGLGYRPAFIAYFRDTGNGKIYQCRSGQPNISGMPPGAQVSVNAKSDNYNITFTLYNNTGSAKNVDIFYEVYYEDLVSEPILFIGGF